jgi:plasmid stability protein
MSDTMVQIRNVPRDVHRRLKARAAMEGLTMSDFVLREVRKALERPTREETLERLAAQPVRRLRKAPADAIRAERNAR